MSTHFDHTDHFEHTIAVSHPATDHTTPALPMQGSKHHNGWFKRLRLGMGASIAVLGLCGLLATGHSVNLYAQPASDTPVTSQQLSTSAEAPSTTEIKMAPVAAMDYQSIARQAAAQAGINPDIFVRQIQQESGFNPGAVSGAGAVGIAQFMPGTAASMGVNPYDPTSALYGAARLMANLNSQFGGDYAKALAAYNAGPGAVQGAVRAGGANWLAMLPGETQHYVHTILG